MHSQYQTSYSLAVFAVRFIEQALRELGKLELDVLCNLAEKGALAHATLI